MKISKEIAEQEALKWLDVVKADYNDESLESLVKLFLKGDIRLDEQDQIVQTLKFPIENADGEVTVRELTFKNRVETEKINKILNGTKMTDTMSVMLCYVSAFTNTPRAVLGKTMIKDNNVSNTIVGFLLS